MSVDHQPALRPTAEPPDATSTRPERNSDSSDASLGQLGSKRTVDLIPHLQRAPQRRQLDRLVKRKRLGTAHPQSPNGNDHRGLGNGCSKAPALLWMITAAVAHAASVARPSTWLSTLPSSAYNMSARRHGKRVVRQLVGTTSGRLRHLSGRGRDYAERRGGCGMEARPAQTARVAYALSFDYLFTGTSKWAGGVFFLAVVRRQVADVAGLEACRARDGSQDTPGLVAVRSVAGVLAWNHRQRTPDDVGLGVVSYLTFRTSREPFGAI